MLMDLSGKKALILGVANQDSMALHIAQLLHEAGATLGFTYLADPSGENRFKPKVERALESIPYSFLLPCDVKDDGMIESVFETVEKEWGKVDILIHSLAFTTKEGISGDFSDMDRDCYSLSLDISAYSLVGLAKAAKPLMPEGGSILTLSYIGGVRVIPNYNMMGICKAALEANVRYLAAEFGEQEIRVNAISAGPIKTLAASAIGGIGDIVEKAENMSALKRSVTQQEVANTAAFLASDMASGITGQTIYVDAGFSIMGM